MVIMQPAKAYTHFDDGKRGLLMSHPVEMPTPDEFCRYQALVKRELGIHLPDQKRTMLGHRLLKRLRKLEIADFGQYYKFITHTANRGELREALELITTNETFFFRETKHFDFLRYKILSERARSGKPFRVWSAACATGEEPYSIAMMLHSYCPMDWALLASDVNETVLSVARRGIYLDDRTNHLPGDMRRRYCRKGTDDFEGYLRVVPDLRKNVQFFQFNLLDDMAALGEFDLIFIRNVLIYFDETSKAQIIRRVAKQLVPGGYLFVGHSESCHGIDPSLRSVQPAILQRTI